MALTGNFANDDPASPESVKMLGLPSDVDTKPLPSNYVAAAPVSSAAELPNYRVKSSPHVSYEKSFVKDIRVAQGGVASRKPTTFLQVLRAAAKKAGDKLALAVERPDGGLTSPDALPLEEWTKWTWTEYMQDAERAAAAFLDLGTERHDSVGVWGFNAPEWHLSCVGAMLIGSPPAGIYPTDTPDQVVYKLDHSNSKVVVLEDEAKLTKLSKVVDKLPLLKGIVMYGAKPSKTELKRADGTKVQVLAWSDLMAKGTGLLAGPTKQKLQAREKSVEPGSCAVLVYTSGTTGNPKAVMTSHDNLCYEASGTAAHTPEIGAGGQERLISYLPLSHVAGFLLDVVIPAYFTASCPGHFSVFFARANDLKDGTIGKRLQFIKPTFFFGVPRVYEKMQEKMMAVGASKKGLIKKIATWGKGRGLIAAQKGQLTEETVNTHISMPWFYGLAKKLVFSKVLGALGLEECKMCYTGAAPISVDTLQYFGQLGLQINEVYGMSESSGVTTISTNQAHRWGSCGFAFHGTEVKAFNVSEKNLNDKTEVPNAANGTAPTEAEQGELCFRGRGIMNGYLGNPRYGGQHLKEIEQKNYEAVDADGYMHSGDKGCVDKLGLVRITGRYKELIIGAGGENIAPVPIEDEIKKNAPAISNAMMVGDKRKYNTCVVTLKAKGATGELAGGDELTGPALLVNPAVTLVSQAMNDPVWLKYVEDAIRAANTSAACPSNAAKIQKFKILPRDFSVETDEFTPTLKLKRSVVCKLNSKIIEEMYKD